MPLNGDLSDFPIEEVISLLNSGKKSGALEVVYTDEEGVSHKVSLFFKNGEIVYATDSVNAGITVIEHLAKLFKGEFRFIPGDVSVQDEEFTKYTFEEFHKKLKDLIDKWKPIKEVFSSLKSIVRLSDENPNKLNLHKNEWAIIAAIGSGISVEDLLKKLNIDEYSLLLTLVNLQKNGIIKVEHVKDISEEILHYIPRRAQRGIFGRRKEITDKAAERIYELINGFRDIQEISRLLSVSPSIVKDKILYLASIGKIEKPQF